MTVKMRWWMAYGLLVGVAALVVAFAPLPAVDRPQPAERTIRVEASQYSYSPSIINVNPGDRVTIQLVSTDVVHGLYVDGYGISVKPTGSDLNTYVRGKPGGRFSHPLQCHLRGDASFYDRQIERRR